MSDPSRELDDMREAAWRFDPLNLGDLRAEAPDEYDSLIELTASLLTSGVDRLDVERAVAQVTLTDWLGIPEKSAAAGLAATLQTESRDFVADISAIIDQPD